MPQSRNDPRRRMGGSNSSARRGASSRPAAGPGAGRPANNTSGASPVGGSGTSPNGARKLVKGSGAGTPIANSSLSGKPASEAVKNAEIPSTAPSTPGRMQPNQFETLRNRAPGDLNSGRMRDKPDYAGSPSSVLQQERDAAKGFGSSRAQSGGGSDNPNIQRGGLGVRDMEATKPKVERGGFGGSGAKAAADKAKLKEEEEKGGFFRPEPEKDKPKRKGRLTTKQKVGGTLALISALGAGGASFVAFTSGPLQFIHISQLLSQFHLDPQSNEGDARMIKIAMFIRHYSNGQTYRTRMGVVGNKMADRIESKFNKAGITSQYTKQLGFKTGYVIEPKKLTGGDNVKTRGMTTPEIVKYYQDNYKVTIEAVGGGTPDNPKFFLNTQNLGYSQFNRLTADLMRSAGYRFISPAIGARIMGIRGAINWHPIEKKINDKLKTYDERLTAWEEEQKKEVKEGSKAPSATPEERKTQDGKNEPGSEKNTDEANRILQEAGAVGNDPTALEKFRSSMLTKYGFLGAGAVGLVCIVLGISKNIDQTNLQNVQEPQMRIGMTQAVAKGDQVADGGKDVDETQLSYASQNQLYKRTEPNSPTYHTSWSDARSIQAELGQPLSGPDMPPTGRIDAKGNVVTRFLELFPGLDAVCQASETVLGMVVIGGVGLVLGGPIFKQLLQTVFLAVALPVVISWIVDMLANNSVPGFPQGADFGNHANYGVALAGNDIGTTRGGLPMTTAEAKVVADVSNETNRWEFQQKPLASRLFDTKDSNSFIAKVIDKQTPDPMTNMAKLSNGLLNSGRTFGSLLTGIFSKSISAAPLKPYDYGFPTIGFTEAEMNDAAYENPFQNADKAATLLDANPEYIQRAKKCFGVDIALKADPDANNASLYTILPPVNGQIPTYKDILDPANNCGGAQYATIHTPSGDKKIKLAATDPNWTSVRFYIFDSQITNGAGCVEGEKQACIDTGMFPPEGATGVAADTCNTASANGGSITGGGPLNNPIPDGSTYEPYDAGAWAKASPYANVHAFGVTVVCSSSTDPVYTVESGNPSWGPNPFNEQRQGATGTDACNPLHIPANTPIPPGEGGTTDGWVIVIDSSKKGLYCAMWMAEFNGSKWSMAYGGVYN